MRCIIKLLLVLCLLASCKQAPKPIERENALAKLEQLYRIRPDSVIPFLDFSGDSLTEFPDLSRYAIDSLDLSHNQLDSLIVRHFPKGIKWLDVSYNCLGDTFFYGELDNIYSLEKVDLSHSRIKVVGNDWWWPATMKTSRGKFFENLLYLRNGNNESGGWFLLELPTDSVSSMKDFRDNGGNIGDKCVVSYGSYIF